MFGCLLTRTDWSTGQPPPSQAGPHSALTPALVCSGLLWLQPSRPSSALLSTADVLNIELLGLMIHHHTEYHNKTQTRFSFLSLTLWLTDCRPKCSKNAEIPEFFTKILSCRLAGLAAQDWSHFTVIVKTRSKLVASRNLSTSQLYILLTF